MESESSFGSKISLQPDIRAVFRKKNQRDFFSGALWEASKMFPESLVPSKVFVNRFFVAEAHPEIPHRRLDGGTRCTNTSSSSDNKHLKHIHHIHP